MRKSERPSGGLVGDVQWLFFTSPIPRRRSDLSRPQRGDQGRLLRAPDAPLLTRLEL